ncbi:hypothetical protein QVD17_20939 [Tagetes erecta]|uniref:Reverse transcriptase n=1 Tax=Tagetes erecta TaxID=13708 RepID=A0AAD8KM43_TARER|nr:hypothetical protein QVD17_20939 [Tagetes erecta]
MGTLQNARSSFLVNGSPTREFCIERGVRQGDPLSLFLFILAMKTLNVVMKKATLLGTFHGIKLPHDGPILSHLFFADDAIFIGEWSPRGDDYGDDGGGGGAGGEDVVVEAVQDLRSNT